MKGILILRIFLIMVTFLAGQASAQSLFMPTSEQMELYSQSVSEHVRAAMKLKVKVDEQNQKEISFLLNEIQERKEAMDLREVQELVHERLKQDRNQFVELKKILDAQSGEHRGSPSLRTSLVKFIGTDESTGILDDADRMLSLYANEIFNSSLSFVPKYNEITVLKTLLIYTLLVMRAERNLLETEDLIQSLELLYPAWLPEVEFGILASNTALYFEDEEGSSAIFVPNAGFIFGGDFIDGICRGIDCSAFLSKTTNSSKRLSTMLMEYAWRIQMKDSFEQDDPEGKIREEFMANWGLAEALEEYEAVEPDVADVQPGDIVVWRWTPESSKARTGHVVMFVEWIDQQAGEFVGIEANREDDKSLEGIVFRRLKLAKENANTYVLRRR